MRTLTNRQARELLVRYHNLDGQDGFKGIEGAKAVMDRLGTIQYDPLNVVGRNAELALQSRVRGFRPEMLQKLLYEERFLVDGYDKEMCIYTAKDFGAFGPQREMHAADMRRWLSGRGQGEAFDMMEDILSIIREKGPCALTDIPMGESKDFGWGPRRPSGAAIEYLFRVGRLCVGDKKGTQRRFDLTERVLPGEYLRAPERDETDFADWYVLRRLACVGLLWARPGGAWQGYVVSGDRQRRESLARLAEQEKVVPCRIEGRNEVFYALPEALAMLETCGGQRHARFIAPLDNLLWDRGMAEALFGFKYRWEVYTPVEKRQYGYYVLPVLYGSRFAARFEPEPAARAGCFRIKNWWWEPDVRPSRAMLEAVEIAMRRFAAFLGVPCAPENMDAVRRAADRQLIVKF